MELGMKDLFYEKYRDPMILRDQLAMDRTILSNERTFLAYTWTALSIVVVGASFIKFLETRVFCSTSLDGR